MISSPTAPVLNSFFHAPSLDDGIRSLASVHDNLDFNVLMTVCEQQIPGIDEAWTQYAAGNTVPARLNNALGESLNGQPITFSGSLAPAQVAALNSGIPCSQVITPQAMNPDLAALAQRQPTTSERQSEPVLDAHQPRVTGRAPSGTVRGVPPAFAGMHEFALYSLGLVRRGHDRLVSPTHG